MMWNQADISFLPVAWEEERCHFGQGSDPAIFLNSVWMEPFLLQPSHRGKAEPVFGFSIRTASSLQAPDVSTWTRVSLCLWNMRLPGMEWIVHPKLNM